MYWPVAKEIRYDLKIFLFLALVAMLFSEADLINFGRGQHVEHFCEILLLLDQWLSRFHRRYFLSRALPTPFSEEQNHLCNFGRGHHEYFCEIILNLDQWLRRRCHLNTFLI